MRKLQKKVILVLLIILLIPVLLSIGKFSYSTIHRLFYKDSNGISQFYLTWVEGSKEAYGKLDPEDESILIVEPRENNKYDATTNTTGGAQVTLQAVFNMGGSEDAPPGAVQIYLPRYMYYDREGNPITDQVMDIPLVEYPEAAGTGYNFEYVSDDEGDWIVLRNYETVPSSYVFQSSFTWILPEPYKVADGFVRKVSAKVKIDLDLDGVYEINGGSNELTMKYKSHAKIDTIYNNTLTHKDEITQETTPFYRKWSNWPTSLKPEDEEGGDVGGTYVYGYFYSYDYVSYATQPYTVTFHAEVLPNTESIPKTDEEGNEILDEDGNPVLEEVVTLTGDVVGYCQHYSYTDGSCFSATSGKEISKEPISYSIANPSASSNRSPYYTYIIKIPSAQMFSKDKQTIRIKLTYDLVGIDGTVDTKSTIVTYTYNSIYKEPEEERRTSGFNPILKVTNNKGGYRTSTGVLDYLDASDDVFVEGGYSNYNNSYNYYSSGQVIGIRLSKRLDTDPPVEIPEPGEDGEPVTLLEDAEYYYHGWNYVNRDDIMLLGNSTDGFELLNYGDYEHTYVGFGEYSVTNYIIKTTRVVNGNKIIITEGWQTEAETNYSKFPVIDVYYKTNGDFELLGSVKFTSSYSYTYTPKDSEESITCNSSGNYLTSPTYYTHCIKLPEGTTGVKAVANNKKYSIRFTMFLKTNLKNSNHVKEIIRNKDEALLYNINTIYGENEAGDVFTTKDGDEFSNSDYKNLLSSFQSIVEEKDISDYGKIMQHNYTATTFNRLKKGSSHINKWVSYKNDSGGRRVVANYTSYAFQYINYTSSSMTPEKVLASSVFNEQRNSTYYDLLPKGMTVDMNSIQVQSFVPVQYSVSSEVVMSAEGIPIDYKASLINNWRNTGRTMLIVDVTVSNEVKNYSVKTSGEYSNLFSGVTLKFTGYYSWDSFYDYGSSITNSIVYMSNDGDLFNGAKDVTSGYSISYIDKDLLDDVDGDGNPEDRPANTLYAQRTMTASFNTASSSSFSIGVKTTGLDDYYNGEESEQVVTSAGGYYDYKLRYASGRGVTTKDLVIYDVLETYDLKNGQQWKGRLLSVDVSQIESKGIKPKIYYSTTPALNLYEKGKSSLDDGIPRDADLTNTDLWSLDPPSDLSKVTAIALDLSEAEDGNPYYLRPEDSVLAVVNMQAPVENYAALADANARAANASWWSGTTQQSLEADHFNFSVFEYTSVRISDIPLDIKKESAVASGTKKDPKVVEDGDELTYFITINNTSEVETVTDISILDSLPEGVKVDFDHISYCMNGDLENKKLLTETDAIKRISPDGNMNLKFDIKQLLADESLTIVLPVIIDAEEGTEITNTASLTGFNGLVLDVQSQTTYHRTKPRDNPETGLFINLMMIVGITVMGIILALFNKHKKIYRI